MTTVEYSLLASHLDIIDTVTAQVAKVAKRIGTTAPTYSIADRFVKDDENGIPREWVTVEFHDVVLRLGDYHLVAVIDHKAGVVTTTPTAPEGTVARLTGHDNTCDHCGTRRERTLTYLVVDQQGREAHVGRNCLKDYLGHTALSDKAILTLLYALADLPGYIDRELFGNDRGRSVFEWVAAAAASIRESGYVPASSEFGTPTKSVASAMLYAVGAARDGLPKVTPADNAFAEQAIQFALASTESSDFALRMKQVAEIPGDADRYAGTAVFIPEAYRRHLEAESEKEARARVERPTVPCPMGKIVLTGEVLSISFKENLYSRYGGSIKKLVVLDDRGFKVYVTEPSSISAEVGDRVSMTVTVEGISDRDLTFGFGKRPSKATVLATAEVVG